MTRYARRRTVERRDPPTHDESAVPVTPRVVPVRREGGISWSIVVPGKPITKGNSGQMLKRGNHVKIEPSKAAKAAQAAVATWASWKRPPRLLTGAIYFETEYRFRIPATGDNRHRQPGEYRVTTPDRGNLEKLSADALEGIVFANDRQIVDGPPRKVWWPQDETLIVATEIELVPMSAQDAARILNPGHACPSCMAMAGLMESIA